MDVFILAAWEREVLWRLMWRGSHLNVTLRCETILPGQLFTFPRFAKNLDFLRQVLGACEAKWKRGSIFLAGPYKATPGTKCEKLRLNINIFRYVFVYLLIKMYNPIIRCLIDRNEPFSSSEKEPESNKIFIHFWWISECAVHNSDSSSVLYDIPLSYFAFLLQSKTRLSPYIWKVLAISLFVHLTYRNCNNIAQARLFCRITKVRYISYPVSTRYFSIWTLLYTLQDIKIFLVSYCTSIHK